MRQVSEVDFVDILFDGGKALFDAGKPVVEYTIEMKEGPSVTHRVVAPDEGGRLHSQELRHPHYFKVVPGPFDELRDTSRAELVKGAESG